MRRCASWDDRSSAPDATFTEEEALDALDARELALRQGLRDRAHRLVDVVVGLHELLVRAQALRLGDVDLG